MVSENVEIAGLRRFKDDVVEVREGFECGINLGSYNDLQARGPHLDVRDAGEAAQAIAAAGGGPRARPRPAAARRPTDRPNAPGRPRPRTSTHRRPAPS
nr:hypothetical protein [Angustibacter aerolatus]